MLLTVLITGSVYDTCSGRYCKGSDGRGNPGGGVPAGTTMVSRGRDLGSMKELPLLGLQNLLAGYGDLGKCLGVASLPVCATGGRGGYSKGPLTGRGEPNLCTPSMDSRLANLAAHSSDRPGVALVEGVVYDTSEYSTQGPRQPLPDWCCLQICL